MDGTIDDVDAVDRVSFNISGAEARLAVAFPELEIDAGARIPIRGFGDSYIEIGPDFQTGGLLLVAAVSVRALFQNHNLPEFGLPDGRAIPGVDDGLLPTMLVQLPVVGSSLLYADDDIFGLFLPVDLGDFPIQITARMRDQFGNLLGVLTAVPKVGDESESGILFLFPIEGSNSEDVLLSSLN